MICGNTSGVPCLSGAGPLQPGQSYCAAANNQTCKTGFGFGVQAGGDAGLGAAVAGAAANGGAGAGLFFGGNSKVSAGAYRGGGAVAYNGSNVRGAPSQTMGPPTVVLGGVGGGAGVFFTNATSASQLAGPFSTLAGGASFGAVGLGVQISDGKDGSGNNIWQLSISYAPGFGLYGYNLTTNTKAVTSGQKCP